MTDQVQPNPEEEVVQAEGLSAEPTQVLPDEPPADEETVPERHESGGPYDVEAADATADEADFVSDAGIEEEDDSA